MSSIIYALIIPQHKMFCYQNIGSTFAASSQTSIETRIRPSLRHHANNFDRQTSSPG